VRENPFLMLGTTPVDGEGLNPLLQDNWMVIHPPIMFVGFALAGVPFAFAMAALWRKDYDRWATRAFPWALAGFLVLGTAILMGGYWAVQDARAGAATGAGIRSRTLRSCPGSSSPPWCTASTWSAPRALPARQLRARRGTYISVLYGTFLTRSGVLADFSVHSFVDLGISGWLIALMGFFMLMAVALLALRLRRCRASPTKTRCCRAARS
jgi:cytochrome c-type biogenesis protein CcmF